MVANYQRPLCQVPNTNNEPDEAVKEMMYIKNALECEARAK